MSGGPPPVKRAGEHDGGAEHVEPPGEEVQAREGHVAGADLDRHDQIAESAGEAGDDEEEDHDHAMDGEEGVVGLGSHDGPSRRHQLDPQQQPEADSDEKKAEYRVKVEEADPLVVGGEDPGGDTGLAGVVPETCLNLVQQES